MKKLKYYIGTRINPQLYTNYYIAYGQLTKKEAALKEKPIYGSISLQVYNDEDDYNRELESLRSKGYFVQKR